MAVWLVAEDRLQIVRASHVTALSAAPAERLPAAGSGRAARPGRYVRILAGTQADHHAGKVKWTALLTFASQGDDRATTRLLEELAVTLSQAESRDRVGSEPVLFVHGSVPGSDGRLKGAKVWHISPQLPVPPSSPGGAGGGEVHRGLLEAG